ncbi:MAG: Acyltransferase family protein [Candidatus Midichloriaceae bacterium]|jgi:peptidoglycan/LPS O-acetylase OafA/YrhL|nr:Acyltransferase family protein [Candidatus Midichloriaceae bacterium]
MLSVSQYRQKEPHIDILRFALAWFVVFAHICPWYDFSGLEVSKLFLHINKGLIKLFQTGGETNPAVLCFITLSGYCIHRNGFRINHPISLRKFFIRRTFRILPLFLLGSIFGAIIFFYCGHEEKIKAITGTSKLSAYGLFLKAFALHSFAPFKFSSVYQGNGPLITAGVEFWLYVFYPLGFLMVKKFGSKNFVYALIALTLIGSCYAQIKPSIASWWHNGSLWGFLIYWYIGVFAVSEEFVKKIRERVKLLLLTYLFISLFLIIVNSKLQPLLEIRKILFALMFGYFLYTLDRRSEKTTTNYLRNEYLNKHLNRIIESSYSTYALHTPIIALCLYFKVNIVYAFLFILYAAYLSYMIIEKPFINFGRKMCERKVL